MLGLLLIYFVGKAFYDLALQHNRSAWGFAILGVISYYGGIILTAFIIAFLSEFGVTSAFDNLSELAAGIIAIPIGVLSCWGFYRILKSQWSKAPVTKNDQTLDGDFMTPK